MQQQVNDIQNDVKEIREALLGNDYKEGIISDIEKNSKHRKNSLKVNGFFTGIGLVLGGLIIKMYNWI